MRVLFITSNPLGDAVLSTGLLGHLVDTLPDARFTIACGPLPAPLFRAVPRVDRVIALRKRSYARHWLALWRACAGTRWDLVVDLRDSAVSRLILARRRAVFRRAPFGTHKVAELAAVLGLTEAPAPRLWLDDAAWAGAAALLPDTGRPLLALGPTANWLSKEWPAERFVELARRLTGPGGVLAGAAVAVFAAGSEVERARAVSVALGSQAIDLAGRTDPPVAAACLARAALYVGNDSGLMHIAAAVDTPTIGLFGPGYPETYAPWGPRCRAVTGLVPRDVLLDRYRRRPDVLDLMDGIDVDAVERAVRDLVAGEIYEITTPEGAS
jgi:heptosyltransferase III